MLDYGDGIQTNKRKAAFYYKKAADLGQRASMRMNAIKMKNGEV